MTNFQIVKVQFVTPGTPHLLSISFNISSFLVGFETARALILHGCHVVMACRDMESGSKAADMIRKEQV